MIEAGKVRVSDKKRLPTAASQKAITEVLQGSDFYTADDADESKHDPAFDLTIKAFALPMLLRSSGLAQKPGDGLTLTSATASTRRQGELTRFATYEVGKMLWRVMAVDMLPR